MLLSTIATGNVDAADVFFLIAVIVFVVAAILTWVAAPPAPKIATTLGYLAAGCLALALLLL